MLCRLGYLIFVGAFCYGSMLAAADLDLTGTYRGSVSCEGVGDQTGTFTEGKSNALWYIEHRQDGSIHVQEKGFGGIDFKGFLVEALNNEGLMELGLSVCDVTADASGWSGSLRLTVEEDEAGAIHLNGSGVYTGEFTFGNVTENFTETCFSSVVRVKDSIPQTAMNRACDQ